MAKIHSCHGPSSIARYTSPTTAIRRPNTLYRYIQVLLLSTPPQVVDADEYDGQPDNLDPDLLGVINAKDLRELRRDQEQTDADHQLVDRPHQDRKPRVPHACSFALGERSSRRSPLASRSWVSGLGSPSFAGNAKRCRSQSTLRVGRSLVLRLAARRSNSTW